MQNHPLSPWARLQRRASKSARCAGTVMLLVVGVLLLVLIVGMTYMHVVQEDRRAGLTVDIDAIVLAQADLAGSKLIEDLGVGATGQHFADVHTNGTTNGTPDGLPDQEPYDYPGDEDKWLAATSPEGAGTSWPQVSMLGEGFWNGTASTDTTRTLTATNAVGAAKPSNGAADSDGDGIMDSKPEQAAIYSRGGLLFFAWARVEDMSSKANLNVWHSQVSAAGAYNATTNAPRWWYPGELDLGGFVNSIKSVNAQYTNVMTADMPGLMGARGTNTALPTPWGTTAGYRGHSWLLNSKFYENPQVPYAAANSLHLDSSGAFDPTNELELRHRNGLVYLDSEAPIEASGRARNLLRGNISSAESAWNDSVPGVSTIANYFTNEPRHQLTTYSGASIYRVPMAGDSSTPFWGKRDINKLLTSANAAANISSEISAVYSAGSPAWPPGVTTVAEFSDKLAVNIIDYADDDNLVTVRNGYAGFEALPAITEVYMQEPLIAAASPTPTGSAGSWTAQWDLAGTVGYAIEVRNPFSREISLQNVHLYVGGTSFGELSTIAGVATLAANDYIVLYRNSTGASANDDVSALIAGAAAKKVAITGTWPIGTFSNTVAVELRAEDQNGTVLTWAYSAAFGREAQGGALGGCDHPGPAAADVVGHTAHRRADYMGNGNGLNAMLMKTTETVFTAKAQRWTAYNRDVVVNLGVADKTAGGPANKVPVTEQYIVADRALLTAPAVPPILHVAELFHIPVLGTTSTETIADAWGNQTSVSAFTPQPGSTSTIAASVDYAVPHAVMLCDRLTTLSPREDGVDNDGDGTVDEADELLIPGTLNLNTAPEFLLDRVLPIGNTTIRQAYVDAIRAYRDTPGTTNRSAANYRSGRKGLAYVSEVYNLSALAAGNDFGRNGASDYNGASFGNIQGDFLANPAAGDDGAIDDAEEKSLVARWLGQTCSTRSDVYCAYILVRGYSPGNLTVPVTERRAAVLLDRSRVATQDDGVRVLGIVWY